MTDTGTGSAEIPTNAEVLARARALAPLIAGHAEQTDRERRVPDAVIDALADAGLFKLGVPHRYGGFATGFETYCDVTAALGESCGSTAWVTALINVCNWCISLFGDEAREEVFTGHPSPRVCGVLAPTSQSRREPGGLRVTGRWGYASGSPYVQWAMLGVPVVDDAGQQIDQGLALIPMADLTIENTWFVTGMRGTASDTLVAQDVFVPDHRILSVPPAIGNVYPNPHTDEVMGRSSFIPVLALILAGPQVGMARGALNIAIEKAPRRAIAYTTYTVQSESVGFQLQIAEAAMLVETADLHVRAAARRIDEAAAAAQPLEYLERAKIRAHTGYAITQAQRAIEIILSAAGASSFAEASPLQRLWRDSSTAARHAVVLPEVNAEIYGKALLGVPHELNITPLI